MIEIPGPCIPIGVADCSECWIVEEVRSDTWWNGTVYERRQEYIGIYDGIYGVHDVPNCENSWPGKEVSNCSSSLQSQSPNITGPTQPMIPQAYLYTTRSVTVRSYFHCRCYIQGDGVYEPGGWRDSFPSVYDQMTEISNVYRWVGGSTLCVEGTPKYPIVPGDAIDILYRTEIVETVHGYGPDGVEPRSASRIVRIASYRRPRY